ncbi:hypothetical protein FVEG_17268 [Fusarium verticillioides 7600]|uniref:Uncharacterized protein n=1 Tax=Gibberella moniliformis (strain M3125 / FGSC 7600) TaxID=334819 RepID=W7MST2_GIBM7|nr:hypothetical protein FVEG_17268 [Fusarium verticillioides 7600]EWG54166.1 hypothetical protein FVEG_17268 [Fusarium verticillioides 7600]RBQ69217.1 hypothetical protein FVER14953_08505 [Fusarium verticillioides]RBQ95641.1 hypothetical protein FVER53263_08505 [Fusarium verticillioides]RBR10407.1 hypothetical protein FVER53590_25504 [Fusarium verticillioides]
MGNSTICMTIYIFKGNPVDAWYKRHVLMYFTSPENKNFHETVHAQRDDELKPWRVDRIHKKVIWADSATYITHVNAGAVKVRKGHELDPVNVMAATPLTGRDADWNCQNFLLEGLQALVSHGYQTQGWYDCVEGDLMDKLLDTNVA